MQRQLQLRIEAQGKYLKKIIEEQQRLSKTIADVPGSGDSKSSLLMSDKYLGADSLKSDPETPPPISESPLGKNNKEYAVAKTLSLDESFSSHNEPLTPDSTSHDALTSENYIEERSAKKPCMANDDAFSSQEMLFTEQILESSTSQSLQQRHTIYVGEPFYPSALSVGKEDREKKL